MGALRPMPRWLRVFLVVNVVEDLATGLSGLVGGTRILIPLHVSPLNARFIGALYVAGAVGVGLGAAVRALVDARIVLYAFWLITVLVLVMTLVYWNDFSADGTPWIWLATYVVDPIVATIAITLLGLWHAGDPGRHRLSPLLAAEAVLLLAAGAAMLVAPHAMRHVWPWAFTPLLARVYAAFFFAFGVAAAVGTGERRRPALVTVVAGSLALFAASATASLVHHDRFASSPQTAAWIAVHAVAIVALAAALVTLRSQPSPGPASLAAAG
jgi:hypothetical protein